MNILTALTDEHLFAPHFAPGSTWKAWRVFLKALFGLEMDADELAIYRKHTGRQNAPTKPFREAWVVTPEGREKSRHGAYRGLHRRLP